MIEALLGLVPTFGFELKDDSERPRTSHRQKLVAVPQELGFCMGRTRLGASAAQKSSRGSKPPGWIRTEPGAHPERAHDEKDGMG